MTSPKRIPLKCLYLKSIDISADTEVDQSRKMLCNKRPSSAERQKFAIKLRKFELRNSNSMQVELLNYGGIISSIKVPDRNGNIEDVLLGFKDIGDYRDNTPYFGAIIGRVANRIDKARFQLDGEEFQLSRNEEGNHLHGGFRGFDKRFWTGHMDQEKNSVIFELNSPDGEEGYPGELDVEVTYTLLDTNELKITYKAVTRNKPTIVNLTSHPYFNLSGTDQSCDEVDDHMLEINADTYLPVNNNKIPTGERRSVFEDGGIFNFKTPKPIQAGKIISMDNTFCKCGDQVYCASLYHPNSGRHLEVHSSQPGVHIYTPNFTCGTLLGKHGQIYRGRVAICIENQNFPNSINEHVPPSPILRPGEVYEHFTTFKFTVKNR